MARLKMPIPFVMRRLFMPIGGVGTYLPTMQEFIAHWTLVNEALPPAAPLALTGG